MAAKDVFEGGLIPVAPVVPSSIPITETAADLPVEVVRTIQAEDIAAKVGESPDLDTIRSVINQALAARDAEVASLRQELKSVKVAADGNMSGAEGAGGYPWMYWRKPQTWPDVTARGWVGFGPGGPTPSGNRSTGSYNLYLKKGMQPITKYGYIEPPTTPEAVHSFLPMLRKGGAVEFPASQVVAYKWHLNPPIVGLKFPQYEAIKGDVLKFICEACGHTLYFLPADKQTAGENYRAHLMVAHKYPFREAAEAIRQSGFVTRPYAIEEPAEVTLPARDG